EARAVDARLGLDGLVGDELLGAGHLLALEADGPAVLEQEGDELAEGDAPTLLQRDHLPPELIALPLVGPQVADVVDGELGHRHSSGIRRSRGHAGGGAGGAGGRSAGAGRGATRMRPDRRGGRPAPSPSDDHVTAGAPPPPQGHESFSRPSVKRPAWLFSARASVSSHSAISSKPSSRAVFAKPGYISVYS